MVERVDRRRFESRNATARNLKGGWDGRGLKDGERWFDVETRVAILRVKKGGKRGACRQSFQDIRLSKTDKRRASQGGHEIHSWWSCKQE